MISVTLKQQENHSLKVHVEEIHKQVRYNCDQCDHKATNKYCLEKHAKAKHNEVRYSCGQCEFKVGTKKS